MPDAEGLTALGPCHNIPEMMLMPASTARAANDGHMDIAESMLKADPSAQGKLKAVKHVFQRYAL